MSLEKSEWEWEIKPQKPWFGTNFRELFAYKDLLFRLVRKEFLLRYQQTILGPLWVLIQPVLTVFVFVIVFNRVMKVPIPDIPPVLFYLSGITLWTLFSDILNGTAATFVANVEVFNKVYFPRLIAPLSITFLHCFRFLIQFSLLLIILLFYYFNDLVDIDLFRMLMVIPPIAMCIGFALGGGLIFSIVTAKYRDLANLLGMFISMLMFICPIFYSMVTVSPNIHWLAYINPLTPLFEMFRYAFFGIGKFTGIQILYSFLFMSFILFYGILLFNKKGDQLLDVL
jgi:lipopolysaccharide transport system permease protein